MGYNSEPSDYDGIYDIYIKNKSSYKYGVNIPDNDIMGASYIEIDNKLSPVNSFTKLEILFVIALISLKYFFASNNLFTI